MHTKTRGGAELQSRLADYLEFTPSSVNTAIIGNKNPIGATSTKQTSKGVWYPNVQAAIDDLASICTQPINSVVMNTDGINPAGTQQVTQLVFSGTASVNISLGESILTKAKYQIMGFTIEVQDGDSSDIIATKLKTVMDAAALKNIAIDACIKDPINPSQLSIRHIDFQNHVAVSAKFLGITMTATVSSPAKFGYGTWFRLGQIATTMDGASTPETIHYFKRIA